MEVKQGGAAVYKEAYNSASGIKVALTGENNNYNLIQFKVTGIWDEETGVIVK